MENEARQKLKLLIKERGKNFYENPRCAAILEEYCVPYRREANLLVNALKEDIPKNLLASQNNPLIQEIINQLGQKLVQNYGTSSEMAQWAVDSWAEALEINVGLKPVLPELLQRFPNKVLMSLVCVAFLFVGLISGSSINSYFNLQSLKNILEQAKLNQSRKEYSNCVVDTERIGLSAPDNLYEQAQKIQKNCALESSKELASKGEISSAIRMAKIANTDESTILLADYFKGREIMVDNKCPYSINVMINFILPNENFDSSTNIWTFVSGKKSRLSIDTSDPIKVIDSIYYLYKLKGAPEKEWRGVNQENFLFEKEISYDSKKYTMKKLTFPESGRFENNTFIISPCS